MIGGAVKQILCIRLGSNRASIGKFQPIRFSNQITKMRSDRFDELRWLMQFADARLDGIEETFELSVHRLLLSRTVEVIDDCSRDHSDTIFRFCVDACDVLVK